MKKTIQRTKTIGATALLAAVFAFAACGGSSPGSYQAFDSRLMGTWETNSPDIWEGYSGTLVIGLDTITITGYNPEFYNPNDAAQRPFKDITKGVARKGYSENGKIYIDDFGLKEFAYEYDSGVYPDYSELLRFNFGGRYETLRKITDN